MPLIPGKPRLMRGIIGNSWPPHTWRRTAQLRAVFPQIRLRLVCLKAIWDLAEIDDDEAGGGNKPALAENLYAGVRIERQGHTERNHDKNPPVGWLILILQPVDSRKEITDQHFWFPWEAACSSAAKRASISSVSIALMV